MQIVAPSLYMGHMKLGTLIAKAASSIPHPLCLLWDDLTLAVLVLSPLLERILPEVVPDELRDTIRFLRENSTAVTPLSYASL